MKLKQLKFAMFLSGLITLIFILSSCMNVPNVPVFTSPNMIYVANYNSNNVSVINGQTNTVVQTISVGSSPDAIGVDPQTDMIYVANEWDNTVSVINGQTNTVVQTVSVESSPDAIGVDP
ncbi:MAG: YncE family protein, partial [Thermoplasmata archaeon]